MFKLKDFAGLIKGKDTTATASKLVKSNSKFKLIQPENDYDKDLSKHDLNIFNIQNTTF